MHSFAAKAHERGMEAEYCVWRLRTSARHSEKQIERGMRLNREGAVCLSGSRFLRRKDGKPDAGVEPVRRVTKRGMEWASTGASGSRGGRTQCLRNERAHEWMDRVKSEVSERDIGDAGLERSKRAREWEPRCGAVARGDDRISNRTGCLKA